MRNNTDSPRVRQLALSVLASAALLATGCANVAEQKPTAAASTTPAPQTAKAETETIVGSRIPSKTTDRSVKTIEPVDFDRSRGPTPGRPVN